MGQFDPTIEAFSTVDREGEQEEEEEEEEEEGEQEHKEEEEKREEEVEKEKEQEKSFRDFLRNDDSTNASPEIPCFQNHCVYFKVQTLC